MDEKKKKGSNIETTTLEKVPMEERKNWIDVALIQAGIMICVPIRRVALKLCLIMYLRDFGYDFLLFLLI